MIRHLVLRGNDASEGALPCRGELGCENETVVWGLSPLERCTHQRSEQDPMRAGLTYYHGSKKSKPNQKGLKGRNLECSQSIQSRRVQSRFGSNTGIAPSKDPSAVNEDTPLSGEILSAIGKRALEEKVYAPALHWEIAVRWEDIIKQGLPEEERENLTKKYPLPENCKFSEPPKINPGLKTVFQPAQISRARIVNKQDRLASALAAIARDMEGLIQDGRDLQDLPVIESLGDAIWLLADIVRRADQSEAIEEIQLQPEIRQKSNEHRHHENRRSNWKRN
ncbi:hypothetical protein TSAR_010146 [Trichomalopsis sarcophagae]|uniref:Uncharacterized protein n=1 Tax=Trichomalopsis sarcophagae TaxID=543379 RepID=A0A232ERR3_9HYME|nr:hypothetical protein TSAR_010146 [Trichomalopsis sarcophagae]